jgi:predicted flap endonuclease-1-like 5' DNA nuclease
MTRWIRIGLIVLLVPILGGLVAIIFWWLINRQGSQSIEYPQDEILLPNDQDGRELTPSVGLKLQVDDLKKIEGIGPKIESVLQEAGIRTYAQLAVTGADRLKLILKDAGVRAAPDTWPEQARLAAVGDWARF